MGQERLELSTPRLSSVCSNQLSYWPPSHPSPSPPTEGPSSRPTPKVPPGPTGQEPPSQPRIISKVQGLSVDQPGRDTRSAPRPAYASPRHHPSLQFHIRTFAASGSCGRCNNPGPVDQPAPPHPIRDAARPAKVGHEQALCSDTSKTGHRNGPLTGIP